ncbi:Kinesin, putative [Hondaea fermentalgiana]|uniref:Kinesin, putative n=1 Tax=Hondaea fermentalgiana TaxID=2315210 RepID=A0A2R5H1F1_9STRA|nr:Kinesin, putative [Hondaea fermentalgiana]|eukprot:GBG34903.1 Kinesin, putative [Hondaea fermentalgiana]
MLSFFSKKTASWRAGRAKQQQLATQDQDEAVAGSVPSAETACSSDDNNDTSQRDQLEETAASQQEDSIADSVNDNDHNDENEEDINNVNGMLPKRMMNMMKMTNKTSKAADPQEALNAVVEAAALEQQKEELEAKMSLFNELEDRVQWLESERVRLLQLTHNKSTRRLSFVQKQQEEEERKQREAEQEQENERKRAARAKRSGNRKSKMASSRASIATPPPPAPQSTAASAASASTSSRSSRPRRSMDGKGVWERTSKFFNVSIKLKPEDITETTTFCKALGIVVERDPHIGGGRFVICEFVRDENGNPMALEACGHVGVDDILLGVKGVRITSTAQLDAALRNLEPDEPLAVDFCRMLNKQLASGDPESIEQANERIAFLEKELKFARAEYARLDIGALESLEAMLHDTRGKNQKLENDLTKLRVVEKEWLADQDLRHRYELKARECRRLLNTLIDYKGAIRIFVRVRPPKMENLSQVDANKTVLHFPENRLLALSDMDSLDVPEKSWEFDAVFNPKSTQTQVFAEVEPLVYSVVDGYNACVFAYGQTGSGKTYTMDGPENDRGVWFRATDSLFSILEQRKTEALENEVIDFTVKVSVLEIYQEHVRDLLAITALHEGPDAEDEESAEDSADEGAVRPRNKKSPFSLEIMHHPKTGYVYVKDAVEETVRNAKDLHAVVERGKAQRRVGVTNMNERSSRSHIVLLIQLVTKVFEVGSKTPKAQSRSKLQLIDLAGSERAANIEGVGERLRETCYINKSLSALGDVMHALQNNDSRHIPFRNSKLTSLLSDSLGGKAKTLMIVQVSPQKRNMPETIRSLDFGMRVGKICLSDNAPGASSSKSGDRKAEQISRLKRENADLGTETEKLKARVLDLKHKLDQERQAKQAAENSLRILSSANAQAASTAHGEGQPTRRRRFDTQEEEEEEAKSDDASSKAQVEALRSRNADLRRKYKEAQQRIEMLENQSDTFNLRTNNSNARGPSNLSKTRNLASTPNVRRKDIIAKERDASPAPASRRIATHAGTPVSRRVAANVSTPISRRAAASVANTPLSARTMTPSSAQSTPRSRMHTPR